jgi:hypothetical protein
VVVIDQFVDFGEIGFLAARTPNIVGCPLRHENARLK